MTANPYVIAQELVEGALMLRARGKFDRDAGLEIEGLAKEHTGACVLNMGEIEYISSSGIAYLVKLHTTFGVRLANPAECVANTISLAGMERILTIHDDEATARDANR